MPAILDGRCARRLLDQAAGTEECSAGAEPKNGKQGDVRDAAARAANDSRFPVPVPARCRGPREAEVRRFLGCHRLIVPNLVLFYFASTIILRMHIRPDAS